MHKRRINPNEPLTVWVFLTTPLDTMLAFSFGLKIIGEMFF